MKKKIFTAFAMAMFVGAIATNIGISNNNKLLDITLGSVEVLAFEGEDDGSGVCLIGRSCPGGRAVSCAGTYDCYSTLTGVWCDDKGYDCPPPPIHIA